MDSGTASPGVTTVVHQALNNNFHTIAPADLNTIADNFSSLRTALNGSICYECVSNLWCGPGDLAYVRGRFAWVRRLMDVNVCPFWFDCPNYFTRVSTIIHEIAHQYPGATDHAYEHQASFTTLGASDAIDNAVSYEVAAREIYHGGAYWPGQTCAPPTKQPSIPPPMGTEHTVIRGESLSLIADYPKEGWRDRLDQLIAANQQLATCQYPPDHPQYCWLYVGDKINVPW